MSSERTEEKPSQAVAVCGESRTHGDNGGDGRDGLQDTALCPYPLKSWVKIFDVFIMLFPLSQWKRGSQ